MEKPWSKEDEQQLKASHKAGKSLKEIALQLSRGVNGVRIKLENLGLTDDNIPY